MSESELMILEERKSVIKKITPRVSELRRSL